MTVAEVDEQPDEINGAIEDPELSQQQQQKPPAAPELPPNNTIYINNLNERVKIEELKKSLHAVFAQFGKILEILAWKSLKLKGQAWVVFDDAQSASNAMRQMQSFPFYDKPMRIRFAKKKSDIIAKSDGTFVPREKKKRHEEKAKKKKEHHEGNHTTASYGYGGGHSMGGGSRSSARDGPAPPNSILFVQNLPKDSTPMMVQMFFQQYPGFKEVRMVDAKPGIAFVEYGDEIQATIAMTGLQGYKIQNSQMIITYAKK